MRGPGRNVKTLNETHRRHPPPHKGAAQRPNRSECVQADTARRLQRQNVGKQAPIENVRPDRAAHDVTPASSGIASKQIVGAKVLFLLLCRREKTDKRFHIAKAKIETLSANRRA